MTRIDVDKLMESPEYCAVKPGQVIKDSASYMATTDNDGQYIVFICLSTGETAHFRADAQIHSNIGRIKCHLDPDYHVVKDANVRTGDIVKIPSVSDDIYIASKLTIAGKPQRRYYSFTDGTALSSALLTDNDIHVYDAAISIAPESSPSRNMLPSNSFYGNVMELVGKICENSVRISPASLTIPSPLGWDLSYDLLNLLGISGANIYSVPICQDNKVQIRFSLDDKCESSDEKFTVTAGILDDNKTFLLDISYNDGSRLEKPLFNKECSVDMLKDS